MLTQAMRDNVNMTCDLRIGRGYVFVSVIQQSAYVFADIGFMFVNSQQLADLTADFIVAFDIHVFAGFFPVQPDGIEA